MQHHSPSQVEDASTQTEAAAGPARGRAGGCSPSQELRDGDRARVDDRRRLPDPPGGDPAGEHRPAPRRLRLGAALQLPARRRVVGRGEARRHRLSEGRPARRRDARARPPVPDPADRGARAARRDPGEGEPEELDRPPRRLHPRDHRPQPPLRRDPAGLPGPALPRGGAAVVRDLRPPGPGAQPAAALDRRRPPRRRRARPPAPAVPAAVHRLSTRCARPSSRSPTASS